MVVTRSSVRCLLLSRRRPMAGDSSEMFRRCRNASRLRLGVRQRSSSIDAEAMQLRTAAIGAEVEPLGQPCPGTHPHLLVPGELTPMILASEYAHRRRRFALSLPTDSVTFVPGNDLVTSNNDVHFRFRQNANCFYLSGFDEPGAVLIFDKRSGGIGEGSFGFYMVVRRRSRTHEMWDGPRTGPDRVKTVFGADSAFTSLGEAIAHLRIKHDTPVVVTQNSNTFDAFMNHLKSITSLHELSARRSTATSDAREDRRTLGEGVMVSSTQAGEPSRRRTARDRTTVDCDSGVSRGGITVSDVEIDQLRLVKSPAEVGALQRAADIACEAFNEVMQWRGGRDGVLQRQAEQHIEALYEFGVRVRGSGRLPFPSIVAAGRNATTLHYLSNSQLIQDSDLVLMDAGATYGGYCSDVTRTWLAGAGNFSDAQRDVYQLVLKANKACIAAAELTKGQLDEVSLKHLHNTSVAILTQGLIDMGILNGTLQDNVRMGTYARYYPHSVSHFLGLDVHDTQTVPRTTALQAGMCITVEPGLYFPLEDPAVPPELRGIGVRIEDDILISAPGCPPNVLTAAANKEVAVAERA